MPLNTEFTIKEREKKRKNIVIHHGIFVIHVYNKVFVMSSFLFPNISSFVFLMNFSNMLFLDPLGAFPRHIFDRSLPL